MTGYRNLAGLLTLALTLAACSSPSETPSARTQTTITAQGQSLELGETTLEDSLDAHFARLGQILPGFGGFSYDEKDQLKVFLTEQRPPEEVRAAIVKVFGEERFERPSTERRKYPTPNGLDSLKLVEGKFTVLDLLRWRAQARDILTLKGALSLDMDEARNRVAVGHSKEADLEALRGFIQKLDLPLEAFVFDVRKPAVPTQATLRDIFRGVPGGVQLAAGSTGCTLGFNVVRNGVEGFVTAGHCVRLGGTTFYQPAWPQVVAYSAFVPPRFTGGNCPRGQWCAFSDAAFVPYMSRDLWGSSVGLPQRLSLARPAMWNGRIDLPFPSARFNIIGTRSFPVVGEEMDKVGKTTGWTYGVVTHSCVDVYIGNNTPTHYLCQNQVTRRPHETFTILAGGDSGSQVFFWAGGDRAMLAGLVSGSWDSDGILFSPISNILMRRELGAFTLR